jgi:hypothetical protein
MQTTLPPTGDLQAHDAAGSIGSMGVKQPDYKSWRAQCEQAPKRSSLPARLFGVAMIAAGIGGWWYNSLLAATAGEFYIKLCIFGPLGVFGGLLIAARPDWIGPVNKNSSQAQKTALFAVIGLMAIFSGVDFYRLTHSRRQQLSFTPQLAQFIPASTANSSALTFLSCTYRLGSYNERKNPMWEFVTAGEDVNDWKTLLTVIDRTDARSPAELDRLAEGIMSTYKSNSGQILLAKTLRDNSGANFNYMVAAFEQPEKHRYELNFVRMAMGAKNAVVIVYGVRIGDSQDYQSKAKQFLDQNSSEIGQALGQMPLPNVSQFSRRVF